MYYKVIKDGKVIDVLDRLVFLKYQKKHDKMLLSSAQDAQAILSSDGNHIWHEKSLHKIPINKYDTVDIEEINQYEYNRLKCLNGKTAEEIIDSYTLFLIKEKIL